MVVPDARHIALVLEVERNEVFNELRTTRQVQVCIIRQGSRLEHLILPVNIWITLSLTVITEVDAIGSIVRLHGMVLIAEVVDERLRAIVCPGVSTADGQLVLDGLVAKHIAIVRVVLTRQFRHGFQRSIEADVDAGLAFHTTLCRDKDNAVSTFHTIDGRCRCVFQHGDGGH